MSDTDILAALKNAHLHTKNIVDVKTVAADPIEYTRYRAHRDRRKQKKPRMSAV